MRLVIRIPKEDMGELQLVERLPEKHPYDAEEYLVDDDKKPDYDDSGAPSDVLCTS